jgi:hypothetical protein
VVVKGWRWSLLGWREKVVMVEAMVVTVGRREGREEEFFIVFFLEFLCNNDW